MCNLILVSLSGSVHIDCYLSSIFGACIYLFASFKLVKFRNFLLAIRIRRGRVMLVVNWLSDGVLLHLMFQRLLDILLVLCEDVYTNIALESGIVGLPEWDGYPNEVDDRLCKIVPAHDSGIGKRWELWKCLWRQKTGPTPGHQGFWLLTGQRDG